MDKEKELLTKTDGKKEGVDFLVPYLSWVYLQLFPSHDINSEDSIQVHAFGMHRYR